MSFKFGKLASQDFAVRDLQSRTFGLADLKSASLAFMDYKSTALYFRIRKSERACNNQLKQNLCIALVSCQRQTGVTSAVLIKQLKCCCVFKRIANALDNS